MANPAQEPDLFDDADEAAERAADQRALADIEEGRTISHDAMKAWLLSWGTATELPPPKCGE